LVNTFQQALALLFLRQVQKELDDPGAVAMEVVLLQFFCARLLETVYVATLWVAGRGCTKQAATRATSRSEFRRLVTHREDGWRDAIDDRADSVHGFRLEC